MAGKSAVLAVIVGLAGVAAGGCGSSGDSGFDPDAGTCTSRADCPSGICLEGRCVPPSADADNIRIGIPAPNPIVS